MRNSHLAQRMMRHDQVAKHHLYIWGLAAFVTGQPCSLIAIDMMNAIRTSTPPTTGKKEALKPLSVFPKDVAVRDTQAWVERTTKARQNEKSERNGHVPRPMNAFFLYRRAHFERAYRLYLEGIGLSISEIVSISWKKLEQRKVREQYKAYAETERRNHRVAHPGYKFSPRKKSRSVRPESDTQSWRADNDDVSGCAEADEDPGCTAWPASRLKDVHCSDESFEVHDWSIDPSDLRSGPDHTPKMHTKAQNSAQGWPIAINSFNYHVKQTFCMASEEALLAWQDIAGLGSKLPIPSEDRTNGFSENVYARHSDVEKLCMPPYVETPETWVSDNPWGKSDALGTATAWGTTCIEYQQTFELYDRM